MVLVNALTALQPEQLEQILTEVTGHAKSVLGSKLHSVILYGSYARGDYSELSDIDIMIITSIANDMLNATRSEIYESVSNLDIEYGTITSIHIQNKEIFDKWVDVLPFYKNIKDEGRVLHGA